MIETAGERRQRKHRGSWAVEAVGANDHRRRRRESDGGGGSTAGLVSASEVEGELTVVASEERRMDLVLGEMKKRKEGAGKKIRGGRESRSEPLTCNRTVKKQ